MEQTIKRYYSKQDFRMREHCDNDDYTIPFVFRYYTQGGFGKPFIASYDGTTYTNCALNLDGTLVVNFQKHDLGTGLLVCDKKFFKNDAQFGKVEDGYRCVYPVELSNNLAHFCEHKEEGGGGGSTTVAYGEPTIVLSYGNATISNEGGYITPVTLTVKQKLQVMNSEGEIQNENEFELKKGDEGVTFTYESDNENVTVDENGKVTFNSVSSSASVQNIAHVKLTVSANGKSKTTEEITIKQAAATISFSPSSGTISSDANGKTETINITKSSGVTITQVSSSNENVAVAVLNTNKTSVQVTIKKSAVSTSRSATITLKTNIGDKTWSVSQSGASVSFTNQTQSESANASKSVSPTIVGSVTINSASSSETWVTTSVQDSKVILNIAAAVGTSSRTATITVGTSLGNKTFTITQSGITLYKIYVGHTSYESIKAGIPLFAALTASELMTLATQRFNSSPASETCNGNVHFMMVKDGVQISQAKLIASMPTTWDNKEWEDPSVWKFVHDDIQLYGTTYHIYGYGNSALSDNKMEVSFN